ncbi:lysophosphatidylserine lipase ABHD12 isoform X1 [Polistes fuscatus]|uniref:lysophosphatidylserine lipase ABHD12 isoform X1 n=1 Tax=Polistes fuscatus TaxID=30207 RepID=UPI001CA884CB|nr:lysophosphatidylserine lipase ABHD12 isoform X1 [Polistes fuscatus]XP_043503491.1 lysophosphatidylserine lipase ABHD12 isoform X1 [Polistes fuscatus]XP_043503493.1 lysophosphatidylserine lipase ABHD12 isoform X1 [Polistes fuscatus]
MRSTYLLLAAVIPFIILNIWYTGICLWWIIKISIVTYIILFGILPLIFHYSYTVQRKILFLNFVHWPLNTDFSKPEDLGLKGVRNFYLHTDEHVKLGVWHILPQSLANDSFVGTDEAFETSLYNSNKPVFLYMHGNSGNRASRHRLELYKLFQHLDYHVICFDYRSYGDSDEADLSEIGIINDTKYIIKWVMAKVNGTAPVFVWGHSLGTGVSTHALALLSAMDVTPTGLILESPFNNIVDEISEHPFAQMFKHLPWFHWLIVEPFYHNGLRFESDKHIENVTCPIVILHAEDDNVIPFYLGEKLYKAGLKYHNNDTNQIKMFLIDASYGFGHNYICRYKALPNIIESFVTKLQTNKTEENI